MRISFDLDDTLICYGEGIDCESRLAFPFPLFLRDEPLRKGARSLLQKLNSQGHEVWIYTTSGRSPRWIRRWFRLRGIRLGGIVNGKRHDQCFGPGSQPSKRPHAFGIDLHIDDSAGVALEGRKHGFKVCVVEPKDADWVQSVMAAVDQAMHTHAK